MKVGRKTLIFGAILLALVLWQLNIRYLPFVVTDPNDMRFDPKQFQVWHYSHTRNNEHQVKPALAKMFPPGTDKAYVDEILVQQAGAKSKRNQLSKFHNPTDQDYSYRSSPSGMSGWVVRFIFDENNKSTMLKMGKRPIYGLDPKAEWLEQINKGGNDHANE